MPFRTKYEIFGKIKAPVVSTYDKKIARIEWYDYLRNVHSQGVHRLVQTVEPEGELSKSEEYMYLVYRIRKQWRKYHDCGKKREDWELAKKLEEELDVWNMRTMIYIEGHPGYKPADEEGFSFYTIVKVWRDTWKERKRYTGHLDCDKQILQEMGRKCRDLERQIDDYIKRKFNLL